MRFASLASTKKLGFVAFKMDNLEPYILLKHESNESVESYFFTMSFKSIKRTKLTVYSGCFLITVTGKRVHAKRL